MNDDFLLALPIQLLRVSHKMVVKEMKALKFQRTKFGNILFRSLPLVFVRNLTDARIHQIDYRKITDKHRLRFSDLRKYRFAKDGPRDRFTGNTIPRLPIFFFMLPNLKTLFADI